MPVFTLVPVCKEATPMTFEFTEKVSGKYVPAKWVKQDKADKKKYFIEMGVSLVGTHTLMVKACIGKICAPGLYYNVKAVCIPKLTVKPVKDSDVVYKVGGHYETKLRMPTYVQTPACGVDLTYDFTHFDKKNQDISVLGKQIFKSGTDYEIKTDDRSLIRKLPYVVKIKAKGPDGVKNDEYSFKVTCECALTNIIGSFNNYPPKEWIEHKTMKYGKGKYSYTIKEKAVEITLPKYKLDCQKDVSVRFLEKGKPVDWIVKPKGSKSY
jgi:hypothetical protein